MIPIPNQALQNSTYLYVGVTCKNQCLFKLAIYYENKIELTAGDSYMMKFEGNETSRIFHYKHIANNTSKFEIFGLAARSHDINFVIHYVCK